MKEQIYYIMVIVGMLLLAVGIVLPLITMDITSDTFRYIYSVGALLLLVGRIFTPVSEGSTLRTRRLYRIQIWGALFFCVAAFFMFWDKTNIRDSIALTLAGGLIQVYTSFMITKAIKK